MAQQASVLASVCTIYGGYRGGPCGRDSIGLVIMYRGGSQVNNREVGEGMLEGIKSI